MTRILWLSLLILCLLVGGNLNASSGYLTGVESAAAVQQDSAVPIRAVYAGQTIIRTTEPLVLRSPWNGASSNDVALTDFMWVLDGQIVSRSAEMVVSLSEPGDYFVELSYRDVQGNRYAATINVRVMEPEEYDTMMAAVRAAVNLPLWLEDEELFLPIVHRSGRERQ